MPGTKRRSRGSREPRKSQDTPRILTPVIVDGDDKIEDCIVVVRSDDEQDHSHPPKQNDTSAISKENSSNCGNSEPSNTQVQEASPRADKANFSTAVKAEPKLSPSPTSTSFAGARFAVIGSGGLGISVITNDSGSGVSQPVKTESPGTKRSPLKVNTSSQSQMKRVLDSSSGASGGCPPAKRPALSAPKSCGQDKSPTATTEKPRASETRNKISGRPGSTSAIRPPELDTKLFGVQVSKGAASQKVPTMLLSPADDLKSLRDERDELLKDRDSLQEEVDSFRTALVRSRKESEEAKKRVLSLSAKNRILEEQLSGLLSKIDFRTQGNRTPPGRQSQELRDENASLKTRLVKEISEKDDTKQQLGAALQKVSEMQSLLKQENSSKAELKKQLLNAQEQVQLAESRLQAEVSTMNGLKAIIRKREQTLSEEHDANMKFSKHLKDLENDISLMRARELSRNTASQGRSEAVKISEAENQRLKAELQSSKKAAADKEKVLLSELADLRQENNKMKGENMSLREKIHKFEIRNTQLQTAYGRLEENYQAEQKAKKAIEAQRPGLLSQTEVLRHDNEAMKKQIAHLTAEKAIEEVAQHARYQEILKEKSVLSQELEDREALVKEQQSIIWRTQTELNTMETGLNSLKLERDNALNEAEQLRIRARQHGEEQLRLQQILADRNTRLQTTYAEAQDVAKLLQESKQRLEKEMQDRAQSQAQMEMVLTAKSDEITTLRTSVKDLNTRLNAEVTQAAKLNQAQTQLRSDLKARSIEMTALRARFNELQAQQLKEADKLRSAQDVEDDLAQLEAHYGTLKEAYQELDCAYGKMVENRNSYHDLVTRFFKATAEHMSRECAGLMGADWFAVDEATREAAARALGRPRVQTEQGPEAPEAQSGPRETLS